MKDNRTTLTPEIPSDLLPSRRLPVDGEREELMRLVAAAGAQLRDQEVQVCFLSGYASAATTLRDVLDLYGVNVVQEDFAAAVLTHDELDELNEAVKRIIDRRRKTGGQA